MPRPKAVPNKVKEATATLSPNMLRQLQKASAASIPVDIEQLGRHTQTLKNPKPVQRTPSLCDLHYLFAHSSFSMYISPETTYKLLEYECLS